MRISKKYIKETCVEMWTVTVECPYCEEIHPYRSFVNNTFEAKCKSCQQVFKVEHGLDDYDMLEKGYCIKWGVHDCVTVSELYSNDYGKDTIDIKIVDTDTIISACAYDVVIDREKNKELWTYGK